MAATRHPLYMAMQDAWNLMRDAAAGEECVKRKRMTYLKPTAGMVIDGALTVNANMSNPGYVQYLAYLDRAIFPDHVEIGIETLVGILNSKPTVVNVPEKMKPILTKFTAEGEDVHSALRKVHEEQLTSGRLGLFVDMPVQMSKSHMFPYVALYKAESIVNWDKGETTEGVDKLNLVVLEEKRNVRSPGTTSWREQTDCRVLILNSMNPGDGVGSDDSAVYKYAVGVDTDAIAEGDFKTPQMYGKPLGEIPFVFVNTKDHSADPDKPPLLGLARKCFSIYRSEADYRQTLYMQSQETLVVVGGITNQTTSTTALPGIDQDSVRVGAGARIDVSQGGDVKYVGVSSKGLSEQRTALENDHKAASVRTGQLMAPGKASLESGESLKTRLAAQTATLAHVAITSATALEKVLKIIAKWLQLNPDEVRVEPNLDFVRSSIDGQDLVQLQTARNLGYPLSAESLHDLAVERGLTARTFEEEVELIKKTPPELLPPQSSSSLNGNNPVQSAGGPKASTAGDQTGAGNQPNE